LPLDFGGVGEVGVKGWAGTCGGFGGLGGFGAFGGFAAFDASWGFGAGFFFFGCPSRRELECGDGP